MNNPGVVVSSQQGVLGTASGGWCDAGGASIGPTNHRDYTVLCFENARCIAPRRIRYSSMFRLVGSLED